VMNFRVLAPRSWFVSYCWNIGQSSRRGFSSATSRPMD
jgi:hypothetical protein